MDESVSADRAISAELAPGERLLWTGRPRRGVALRNEDIFLVPFSVLWLVLVISWFFRAVRSDASEGFALVGLAFVVVGVYVAVGRFFVEAWQRGQTAYGLTDQRAIIVSRSLGGGQEVKSVSLRPMPEVNLATDADGSGTITFGSQAALSSAWMRYDFAFNRRNAPPAFEMINNARHVYELLRQAQPSEARTW